MLVYVVRSAACRSRNGVRQAAKKKLNRRRMCRCCRRRVRISAERDGGRDGKAGDQSVDLGVRYTGRWGLVSGSRRWRLIRIQTTCCAAFEAGRRHNKVYRDYQAVLGQRFGKTFVSVTAEDIKSLPDSFQLSILPEIPSVAHTWAGTAPNARHSAAQLEQELARAKALAEAQLAVADRMKTDPRSKPASYAAHLNLGVAGTPDWGPPWRGRSPESCRGKHCRRRPE